MTKSFLHSFVFVLKNPSRCKVWKKNLLSLYPVEWTKYNSKFYFKAAVSRPRKTWLVQIPLGTQWRLILFCAARDLSRSVIIVKTSFETEPTDETGRLGGGCVISLDKHNRKRHTKKACRGLIFQWKGLNISKQIWSHNIDETNNVSWNR